MAQSFGANISSTLHHRGEHEVGAIVDPNDDHVYVPRAMWTSSADNTMKASHAQFDKQKFVADELKRLAGVERQKEYYRRSVDNQLDERNKYRSSMFGHKKDLQGLLNDDTRRHEQDQERLEEERKNVQKQVRSDLDKQTRDYARRAYEHRLNEAQEAAEIKMRTVQTLCEEIAEQSRRKQKAQREWQDASAQNEAKKNEQRAQRIRDNDHEKKLMQDAMDRAENREAAAQMRLKKAQDQLDAAADMFNRQAGKADRDREHAEVSRIDRDELKHTLRTDAYYLQRDRARERQRQNMVGELDRQKAANSQRLVLEEARKKAERDAIQDATRRALDADLAKAAQKKAEEVRLQQELRVMMAEKEQRETNDGYV
jgi:hypothetical protein